jgi:GntR family transcriptional repressor for pyruvate dehydrogenase complex
MAPRSASEPGRNGARVRPLRRTEKISQVIARDIVRQIYDAEMAPGTRLPSEAQMLSEYDVGRASLREALRILEANGLISMRPGPGGGPVVGEASALEFGRVATLYFQMAGMTWGELAEARLIFEPICARLAAERRDPALIEALKEVDADARKRGHDDDRVYLETGRDFHRLVSELSDNRILNLFSRSLDDIFHDRVEVGMLFPKADRHKVIDVHGAIGQAIIDGDADLAEHLMREHMREYTDYVKTRYSALMDEVIDWR